ncbi:MAG: 23S rRNA (adenine(2503)-C(2))-methyltransferase RlmN [bacterium]|nr:23S rRNA (adenine(2503)-C(2))-methyltransferase RlmN [bacterium]
MSTMESGKSAYQVDPSALGDLIPQEPAYRADQLREWLYQHPVLTTGQMTNLPAALRTSFEDRLWPFVVEIEQSADDGRTRKWLFRTPDGASIEAVLMGYRRRTTLCISSQAGCAMACTFCATGQFGFERHLDAGEIVAQVAYANAVLQENPIADSPDRVTNVVFMGMGEPLANYENLRQSLHRMIDVIDMAARSVTVSTVGVVPGIRRLADEPWQVGLAVSLHAADDKLRSSLIPLNKRYPLDELVEAISYFFDKTGRRVSIEWTMMAGINDNEEQARKLAAIARQLRAHVNVISFNPTPLTDHRRPGQLAINDFMRHLADHGANATFRETRGQDIDAACGQLRVRGATESKEGTS